MVKELHKKVTLACTVDRFVAQLMSKEFKTYNLQYGGKFDINVGEWQSELNGVLKREINYQQHSSAPEIAKRVFGSNPVSVTENQQYERVINGLRVQSQLILSGIPYCEHFLISTTQKITGRGDSCDIEIYARVEFAKYIFGVTGIVEGSLYQEAITTQEKWITAANQFLDANPEQSDDDNDEGDEVDGEAEQTHAHKQSPEQTQAGEDKKEGQPTDQTQAESHGQQIAKREIAEQPSEPSEPHKQQAVVEQIQANHTENPAPAQAQKPTKPSAAQTRTKAKPASMPRLPANSTATPAIADKYPTREEKSHKEEAEKSSASTGIASALPAGLASFLIHRQWILLAARGSHTGIARPTKALTLALVALFVGRGLRTGTWQRLFPSAVAGNLYAVVAVAVLSLLTR